MTQIVSRSFIVLLSTVSSLAAVPAFAQAQGAPVAGPQAMNAEQDTENTEEAVVLDEIVVTARKRDETSISVPVTLTAIGEAELERRAINDMDSIARVVPSLIIGDASGSLQGGNIVIRGIGGADNNPLGDQAVSFNIDGVQIARSTVRRLATMDMQQVEVLKGPQALFFGKNSPGGVISVRTADPGDRFEAKLSGGYEFNADEWVGDGYISGPLTETIGVRAAFFGSRMKGWLERVVPETSPYAPLHRRAPRTNEYAGRLTLTFDPSDRFDARAKFSYSRLEGDGNYSGQQLIDCPLGRPQPVASGIVNDCKADRFTTTGDSGPTFATINPLYGDGHGRNEQNQILASLEMNYDVTDALTLTSVTGFYDTYFDNISNFTTTYFEPTVSAVYFRLDIREINQELRLTSDFDGPLNFMVGGYYQNSEGETEIRASVLPRTPTATASHLIYNQEGETYSAFGQLRWLILPTLELAAGGRYSRETKELPFVALGNPGTRRFPTIDSIAFNDFSPEATLTWRPTQRLTLFGAYKTGFLSGGFNTSSTLVGPSIVYEPENVEGFEIGAKTLLFDDTLRANLSLYRYEITDLQVSTAVATLIELRNATSSTIKGGEFDFSYRTPVTGLSLSGAVAYTDARYGQYFATCYAGLASPACSSRLNPATGVTGLSQDLSGARLVRAPEWSGNLGFNYEAPVSSNLKFGLSGNMSFSSSFFTDAANKPQGLQDSYQLYDATVRLADRDDRWEVALIGRNLSNVYYYTRSLDNPFTGSGTGTPTAVLSDTASIVARPREVLLRATVKFGR